MPTDQLKEEILQLKKEKDFVILAHYYQSQEVKDVADYIGDSLFLAQTAKNVKAANIIMAGVYFMAETVKILNPEAHVFLPDFNAGCSLADSVNADDLKKYRNENPGCRIISYINCSAEVKAVSDIICTSSNAVKIANLYKDDKHVLFVPDSNLGKYVNSVTGLNMHLWNGSCIVHEAFSMEKLMKLIDANPGAVIIAHPESPAYILRYASFIGSTTALIDFAKKSSGKIFIIATEAGIIDEMKSACPEKKFIPAPANEDNTCACSECAYMKMITLNKILKCMKENSGEISMNPDLISLALKPLDLMLKTS